VVEHRDADRDCPQPALPAHREAGKEHARDAGPEARDGQVRAQYRDNVQKQREEMAKVYQERGVNPLGGCLPILVQMPIFIGIFYVIRQFGGYRVGDRVVPPRVDSFHEGGILWFQNLSNADPTYLLPIISAVTMLAATEITSKHVDPQQRWLMRPAAPSALRRSSSLSRQASSSTG
jgi:YidC/Oxa1 family membrane protein insertase